ncbi:MAG: hypothetical protein IPO78_13925 [Saprospiraceae bacterium]|nr:hypothetical protein [Saprospiraceae bacterium]MBK9722692.1 hypothetical protein [Saprospiraceae bacterium]MBK9726593.1 hypothetical protein [Saprospiraceae bacterium]
MTIKKQKLIETFQALPEDVTLDQILDHIMLMDKIEEGLRQSDSRNVIPDEELEKHLPKWFV